jgi:hypothetical protein
MPKFVKKLEEVPVIDLPPAQPMSVVVSLADRALVGQFTGLWPSPRTTENWIQKNWRPLISNSVTCYAVGRGFFLFEFISKEDRDLIFRSGPYFMGPQGLYLNRWTPDFDPEVDVPKAVPVWVRLPNLSIHCWNPSSLQTIGNRLGRFIDKVDPKGQYSCARICVEVDLEAGLPEAIKLTVGDWQHYQKLDYEQLSFKCRNCHEYRHFQKQCPKIQIMQQEKESGEGWQQAKRSKANPNPNSKKEKKNQKGQSDMENSFAILGNQENESLINGNIAEKQDKSEATSQDNKESPPQLEPGEIPESQLSEIEEETSEEAEGEADTGLSQNLSKPATRGRKMEKERRERETYKDKLQGSQPTLETMLNPRSTRNQGKPSHRTPSNPKSK